MTEFIQIGDISIAVTRKDIKNVHLSVHPPEGRVSLSAPTETRLEVARAYAITRLSWIEAAQPSSRNTTGIHRTRKPLSLGSPTSADSDRTRHQTLRNSRP